MHEKFSYLLLGILALGFMIWHIFKWRSQQKMWKILDETFKIFIPKFIEHLKEEKGKNGKTLQKKSNTNPGS